ncbi:hypothetical protein AB4144_65520, partial [Rhizobiaceae sp. 2RAB30]
TAIDGNTASSIEHRCAIDEVRQPVAGTGRNFKQAIRVRFRRNAGVATPIKQTPMGVADDRNHPSVASLYLVFQSIQEERMNYRN